MVISYCFLTSLIKIVISFQKLESMGCKEAQRGCKETQRGCQRGVRILKKVVGSRGCSEDPLKRVSGEEIFSLICS